MRPGEGLAQTPVLAEELLPLLVLLPARLHRLGGEAADDLQQHEIRLEVVPLRGRALDAERADDALVAHDGHADEGEALVAPVGTRAVEEARIGADVVDYLGPARLRDAASNAFADAIAPALLLGFVEPLGGLDAQLVAVLEGESAAEHAHAAVKQVEDVLEQGADVPLEHHRPADLLDDRNGPLFLVLHEVVSG